MKTRLIIFLLILAFLVNGCSGAEATATPVEVTATEVDTQVPSPTFTLEPTNTPTIEPTSTETPTPRPTNTPVPTPTPVYSDPDLGYPYFVGEEIVDVLAMSKARCIQDLYSYHSGYINQVMEEKGLDQIAAVNHICSMPVTTCDSIPNPYVRIPILGLGEVWEDGLANSSFSYMYQNVPTDEFVPGVDYCWMGLDQAILIDPNAERTSLCPDPAWDRTGYPSREGSCQIAAFVLSSPSSGYTTYSGMMRGQYVRFEGMTDDGFATLIQDTLGNNVGSGTDSRYSLEEQWARFHRLEDLWIVIFVTSDHPFLQSLGWEPIFRIDVYGP